MRQLRRLNSWEGEFSVKKSQSLFQFLTSAERDHVPLPVLVGQTKMGIFILPPGDMQGTDSLTRPEVLLDAVGTEADAEQLGGPDIELHLAVHPVVVRPDVRSPDGDDEHQPQCRGKEEDDSRQEQDRGDNDHDNADPETAVRQEALRKQNHCSHPLMRKASEPLPPDAGDGLASVSECSLGSIHGTKRAKGDRSENSTRRHRPPGWSVRQQHLRVAILAPCRPGFLLPRYG